MRSWGDPKVAELLENSPFPSKEKEEMESGLWLIRYILKNPNATKEDLSKVDESAFKNIFHDNYDEVEKWKTNGKIDMRTISWMTQPGVPLGDREAGWNVVNNTKLKKMFAEYFSNERTKEIIRQQNVHGPKILSSVITGDPVKDEEIRKKELEKISPKDREELEKILGKEDWETFQKTGRIPYKIKGEELRIGSAKTKDKNGKIKEGDSPKIILPYVKIGEGDNERSVPLLNTPSFIRSSVNTDSIEISKLKNKILSTLKKSKINTDSVDLDSVDDLEKLLNSDKIKDNTKDLIKNLIVFLGEDPEKSLMTTPRSGVIIGKDGKETTLNNFYKVPRYSHGLPGTRITGFRPEVSSQVPGAPHNKETRIGFAKIFPIGSPVMGSDGLVIGKETWDYFKRNPELVPKDASPMKYVQYDLSDTGPDDAPRSSSRYIEESFSLSDFRIIKESDESDEIDRDTGGARKGGKLTAKWDRTGTAKHYYQIVPTKDGYGNLSGWNDIVEGMSAVFLKKKYSGVDANRVDIREYIKDFQRIHDEIVDVFYLNARDEDLYTSLGRKTRASSEADKFLSRENEATGSKGRKSRTSTESMIMRNPKSSTEPQEDINNIEPLAYDKSFDKQKRAQFVSIFFDTNNQIVFTSNTGKTWTPTVQMPDSDAKQPYVFRKNKNDLMNALYSTSNILRFLSENSDKIDVSNHKKIIEILNVEEKNLLSFWASTFPQYSQHYKTTMDKIGGHGEDLLSYIQKCDTSIPAHIENVYEAEKEELNKKASKKIIAPKQEIPIDSQIEAGYNNMLAIAKEIEKIIEDESYGGENYFNKVDKKLVSQGPKILLWYDYIRQLLINLTRSVDTKKKESLIQIILRHKGGKSNFGQGLKYPMEAFLNKISSNFGEFAKLMEVQPPKSNTQLAKYAVEQAPKLQGFMQTKVRSEFIKQAKEIK
jgi:succinate dehydrogenase flavin-adding protein (antitoxin of CptAB toxin-antitoxin module)